MNYQLEEISIELTRACCLKCIHCSSEGGRPMLDELTREEVISILTQARALGATVASFSGGDPVIAHHVLEYLAVANELGYKRILFYTEGVLDVMDSDFDDGIYIHTLAENYHFMDELIAAGGDALTVICSLHSHKPVVHDYITGVEGSFHAVVENILELRRLDIPVEVHMVPMLPNYKDISKLRDYCAELGVLKLSLLRYVPQGRGKNYDDQLRITEKMFVEIQHTISKELARNHPVALRAGCPINFLHTIDDTITEKIHPCHAGTDLILVRPDGTVHPCAAWKTLPADDNVRQRTLQDIWEHGRIFNALRAWHEYKYEMVGGLCKKCGYQDSCRNGCPAQRLHAVGATSMDWLYLSNVPDPLCPMRLRKEDR